MCCVHTLWGKIGMGVWSLELASDADFRLNLNAHHHKTDTYMHFFFWLNIYIIYSHWYIL